MSGRLSISGVTLERATILSGFPEAAHHLLSYVQWGTAPLARGLHHLPHHACHHARHHPRYSFGGDDHDESAHGGTK